jgi:ssDNA-binding Zn-finger/Zn-ribbon topoisomerase 1
MKAHQITLFRGGAAKRQTHFCHCFSKRSLEIEAENVITCDICYKKGVSYLHASFIGDEYYPACKYEKNWIMENYPLLVEAVDSRLKEPYNQPVGEAVLTPDGCA